MKETSKSRLQTQLVILGLAVASAFGCASGASGGNGTPGVDGYGIKIIGPKKEEVYPVKETKNRVELLTLIRAANTQHNLNLKTRALSSDVGSRTILYRFYNISNSRSRGTQWNVYVNGKKYDSVPSGLIVTDSDSIIIRYE